MLFNQQGEAFKNEGKCTSAGAKGELAGVDAVVTGMSSDELSARYSGFGLKPGSGVLLGARYQPSGFRSGFHEIVSSNGTFSEEGAPICNFLGSPLSALVVAGETAGGTGFEQEFPAHC